MIPCKPQQLHQKSSESGFTIIESLVAMVVVAIMMAVAAPVIVLSVATRVQAKRVETATNAARAYIDGVRTGAILAPTINTGTGTSISSVAVPTSSGSLTCNDPTTTTPYCSTGGTQLYCVSLDDIAGCSHTSNRDLLIQPFGYHATSTDSTKGYQLGVRVYRADAFKDSTVLQKGTKQRTDTGGLGSTKRPLIEMTTEVVTTNTKYTDLCGRIGGCT